MNVLFLEVTLERQDQNVAGERVNIRFTPTEILNQLKTLQAKLEKQPGFLEARLLQNTENPLVILLESTWKLEIPGVLEGFPFEDLKCRRWSFKMI